MTILGLIRDYLSAVEDGLVLFERKFGRRDLVRAWREGVIAQAGTLSDGVEYRMHGVGCAIEYRDYDVDFDFAGRNEVGFDAWRLWRYAKQFPARYPDFQELSTVEEALGQEFSDGTLVRVDATQVGESNETLLQLSDREKTA